MAQDQPERLRSFAISPDDNFSALGMIAFGDFIEIYSATSTARMQNLSGPDNSAASPIVITQDRSIGSRNLIVARVLLQSCDLIDRLQWPESRKTQVRRALLSCKDALVACNSIARRVLEQDKAICDQLRVYGVGDGGNSLHLPQVVSLNEEVSSYLIGLARAVRSIYDVLHIILEMESRKKKNFDSLSKTLEAKFGIDFVLLKYVNEHASRVREIISMRNYDEHPGGDGNFTVVRNFHVEGKRIKAPTWHLHGKISTEPKRIADDMVELVQFVSRLAETSVILAVDAIIKAPWVIVRIPPEHISADWPIAVRMTIEQQRF